MDDFVILIECLNGYWIKERVLDNLGIFWVVLGVFEILENGIDVILVIYGSCVRIV